MNTQFKKGQTPWNKGKKFSEEIRLKMSLAKIGKKLGEKSHMWKGNRVGYRALHEWVESRLGKPSLCEECGTTTAKRFHWANISKEYKRELSDWRRLCASCHSRYDKSYVNANLARWRNYA